MMRFSTSQVYPYFKRRHVLLLMVSGILMSLFLALWYLPYADPPMFVYRALRADPGGYLGLRKQRWLAYLEKASGLVTVPELHIQIKPKHMALLRKKREAALQAGILIQESDDFVPATIHLAGKSIDVKLRLKGDKIDHIRGATNWSYRVQTKADGHVFGMRRFSLQDPGTRNFQYESLFFETARLFDVLVPRYFFVSVVQNGNPLGLMAFEEHFSRALPLSQGRPESVIIRLDESIFWEAEAVLGPSKDNLLLYDDFQRTRIDAFQTTTVKSSPELSKDYTVAVGLLRGFIEGHLPASHVFDLNRMAGFIASAHFWHAWHGLRWHNLRFYYNPTTMRLEPIAFDMDTDFHQDMTEIGEPIIRKMLEDPVMYTAYRRALETLIASVDDDSLITRLKKVEAEQLRLLLPESRYVRPFYYPAAYWRAEELRMFLGRTDPEIYSSRTMLETLNPVPLSADQYPQVVLAYRINEHTPVPYLELANLLPFPVMIQHIYWETSQGHQVDLQLDAESDIQIILPASLPGKRLSKRHISYTLPKHIPVNNLIVTASLQNDDHIKRHTAWPYVPALTSRPAAETGLP